MQSADRIRPDGRSDASLPREVRNRASGLEGARATHGVSPSVVITPAPRSPGSAPSSPVCKHCFGDHGGCTPSTPRCAASQIEASGQCLHCFGAEDGCSTSSPMCAASRAAADDDAPMSRGALAAELGACALIVAVVALLLFVDADVLVALLTGGAR